MFTILLCEIITLNVDKDFCLCTQLTAETLSKKLVYNVNKYSESKVKRWFFFIGNSSDPDWLLDCNYVPMVIVGNKSDLEHERQVSTQEGKDLVDRKQWGPFFFLKILLGCKLWKRWEFCSFFRNNCKK